MTDRRALDAALRVDSFVSGGTTGTPASDRFRHPSKIVQAQEALRAAIEAEAYEACVAHQAEAISQERARIKAAVEGLAGPLCVCGPSFGSLPVCETHSELCFDGRCEDFPTWLPALLAIIDGREP